MALYRFLFAPVLLAVAVWAGPGDRHAAPQHHLPPGAPALAKPATAQVGASGPARAMPGAHVGTQR
jgi:hypothetical protein